MPNATPPSPPATDPFAAKRAAMRAEFFGKLFLLGGWLGGTDTYKRTMWSAVPDVALAQAGYNGYISVETFSWMREDKAVVARDMMRPVLDRVNGAGASA